LKSKKVVKAPLLALVPVVRLGDGDEQREIVQGRYPQESPSEAVGACLWIVLPYPLAILFLALKSISVQHKIKCSLIPPF
jgi:hypothetical protein